MFKILQSFPHFLLGLKTQFHSITYTPFSEGSSASWMLTYSSVHILLWIFNSGLPLTTETLHALLSLPLASTQVTGTSSSVSHCCSIITMDMLLESATRLNPAFLCSWGTDTSLSLFHEAFFKEFHFNSSLQHETASPPRSGTAFVFPIVSSVLRTTPSS